MRTKSSSRAVDLFLAGIATAIPSPSLQRHNNAPDSDDDASYIIKLQAAFNCENVHGIPTDLGAQVTS